MANKYDKNTLGGRTFLRFCSVMPGKFVYYDHIGGCRPKSMTGDFPVMPRLIPFFSPVYGREFHDYGPPFRPFAFEDFYFIRGDYDFAIEYSDYVHKAGYIVPVFQWIVNFYMRNDIAGHETSSKMLDVLLKKCRYSSSAYTCLNI
jgi:hypothetical protein